MNCSVSDLSWRCERKGLSITVMCAVAGLCYLLKDHQSQHKTPQRSARTSLWKLCDKLQPPPQTSTRQLQFYRYGYGAAEPFAVFPFLLSRKITNNQFSNFEIVSFVIKRQHFRAASECNKGFSDLLN